MNHAAINKKAKRTIRTSSTHNNHQNCPKHIVKQHFCLGGDPNEPLAIYKRDKNSKAPSFLHKRLVESWLNRAGAAVCGNQVKQLGKNWTLHSICIGATALLFAETGNKLLIRNRLQWDSKKWWAYVCHTPIMAKIHVKAIADVDVDNFDISK